MSKMLHEQAHRLGHGSIVTTDTSLQGMGALRAWLVAASLALALVIAASATACATGSRLGADQAFFPMPYIERLTDSTASQLWHADAFAAVGLADLRRVRLPEGMAEVRLVFQSIGIPEFMVRVIDNGRGVSGWVYYWWSDPDREVGLEVRHWLQQRTDGSECMTADADRTIVCRAGFDEEPDWTDVLRGLVAERVFDLPTELDVRGGLGKRADGADLIIETVRGDRYHSFRYWMPQAGDVPESVHAQRLDDIMTDVLNQSTLRTELPDTVGPDRSDRNSASIE